MTRLFVTAIARPRTFVAIGVLVVLLAAPGMLRLRLRTDGHALVPEQAPEVLHDAKVRSQFGLNDPVVILIRSGHADGVFNFDTLSLVVRLTDACLAIDGVRPWTAFSLATEHNDRVFPGTLRFRRFLEPFPETVEDLSRLRDDLRAIKLYSGTLVSRDESATAVMVGVPPGVFRADFYERIRSLVDELGPIPDRIDVIGAPVAEALLGTHIMEDLGVPRAVLGQTTYSEHDEAIERWPHSFYELRVWIGRSIGLLPIAIAIMGLTFLIYFRSLAAAALPMLEVLAGLVFVFGVMGWCGVPVYLTIAVLPIILVVTGVTDEIHVFTRYVHLIQSRGLVNMIDALGQNRAATDAVRDAIRELWPAVAKTSLTTAVGCLSFGLSPLAAVQAFGVFTAVGVVFCMFWSLTVIPASLVLIGPRRLLPVGQRESDHSKRNRTAGGFRKLANGVRWVRFPIIVVSVVLVALAPQGVRKLRVQDSWIDGFAPESAFRQATEYFNGQFLGTHMLHVVASADLPEPITGSLPGRLMQAQSITLPPDVVTNPKQLEGLWIKFRRADAAPEAPIGERPDDDALRERAIKRVGTEWAAPIEDAKRTVDGIEIRCGSRHGSARAALRLYGGDEARFEIYARPMMSPQVLRRLGSFERFLTGRKDDAVGGALGPASYIETTNFMSRARNESDRSIPDKADRVEWLWEQYQRIRGVESRRQIVSDDYTSAIVTIYLNAANFVDTARLLDAIRYYARTELEPQGIRISFAGDVAVSQTLIGAIVTTQVRSLIGSIAGIVLITALLGRSLLWGILSALPCALAVLFNFAIMGWVHMPLGVATSMFTGMTLGMGIDYAVHLIERYRFNRNGGVSASAALADAVGVTGPAIFVDAAAVALGFGVLMLSQVPANARFGMLVILSLVICLIGSFILLPALISLSRSIKTEPRL